MIEIVKCLNTAMLQENGLILLFDLSGGFFLGGGGGVLVIVRYQQIKMKQKVVVFFTATEKR